MKALIARGVGNVEFGEWRKPEFDVNDVLIRVGASGICGTDVHVYKGLPVSWTYPGIRGHEFVGTVQALGAVVRGLEIGDHVAVQPLVSCGVCDACASGRTNQCSRIQLIGGARAGGNAELVAVPADRVFKLPHTLDWASAALVEPLAVAVHLFDHLGAEPIESVAVFGAGTQGLLALQVARLRGAHHIAITDVIPHRLDVARQLGATCAIHARESDSVAAILEMNGGKGVDLVIEASGNHQTRQDALKSVRAGGTVVLLALNTAPTPLDLQTVIDKEIRIQGTQAYTDTNFSKALERLAAGAVQVKPLITEMPLREGAWAMDMLARDPGAMIKVVLRA